MIEPFSFPAIDDEGWGPVEDAVVGVAHPVANELGGGAAQGARVCFDGAAIDALLLCRGAVLRTAEPEATRFGVAQVRRYLRGPGLRVSHVVFAPAAPRPLLLGLARIANDGREPVLVEYTELWNVAGKPVRVSPGACVRRTPGGERALADIALAVRSAVPDPPPELGLCLELRLVVPPGGRRELGFAYAAPPAGESPAALVRAWRGEAVRELGRTVTHWLRRLGVQADDPKAVAAYRGLACSYAERCR